MTALTNEFGLSDAELDEISKNRDTWNDERLRESIEFVRHRCATTSVRYPAKYLMSALRDGYRIGSIEKEAKKVKATKKPKIVEQTRPTVILPEGDALESAWLLFKCSPHAKLFKNLPDRYELADSRQRIIFEGFLQSQ